MLEQDRQAPRAVELRGALLASLPRGQPDPQAARRDDEQKGHDAQREEQLEQGEALRARARRHGSGFPATARRLAISSARVPPHLTATESE